MARKKVDETETVPKVRRAPKKSQGNPDEIVWERPSGTTITTNNSEATVDYCESLGWKRT